MIDRRGVSNTLGFVLLFGVVFFSIVAVHTFGVGALEQGRDATIKQNAALSMESLSDAIEDLREENTTTRLSVIRGGGGTFTAGATTEITIRVSGPSNLVFQDTFKPIVYRFEETRIVYEAGALIRTQEGGGAVLIDSPEFKVNNQAAILPIITTTSASSGSVSGSTVTTYLEKTKSILKTKPPISGGTVTFRIETTPQRAAAWERILKERTEMDWTSCTQSGGTLECTAQQSSGTVIVRQIGVSYEFAT